jgi:MFS family permease
VRSTLSLALSFDRPVKLLLVNQLTINIGFYMLMPYLANHLSGDLGLAAWLVGLILGVRNLTQQGLFLIGGSFADRLGYKPMILAGLALRTVGFALLGLAQGVPALLAASALTGLAGALFNPAARAYLAREAGDRKVEAFAVFNVFYQLGIVIGPMIGLLLGGFAFRLSCLVAAGLFALLAAAQYRALPARPGGRAGADGTVLGDWRRVLANRAFLLFSLAMIGSYVLNFQIYLGLPIEVRRTTGGETGVMLLFAVSGALALLGQVRVTAWVKARWTCGQALARGLLLMGMSFLPLALIASQPPSPPVAEAGATAWPAYVAALAPVLLTTALLSLATMIVYPFEMATIATLGGDHMIGTYYGFYNTLSGIGIAAGNLLTGAFLDTADTTGIPGLTWWCLTVIGIACALAVHALHRAGRLHPAEHPHPQTAPT